MKMKSRSGMWTMFLVGLVLCFQAISAMAASTKTIIIRDDDAEAYFDTDLLEFITDTLITNGIPQTIAVIPANTNSETLGDDTELVAYLNTIKTNSLVELALHGYRHSDNEFGSLTLAQAQSKIVAGLAILNQVVGVTPITFVPPDDAFNTNTLTACKNEGFTRFSAADYDDPNAFLEAPTGLLHVPSMVDFQDWDNGGVFRSSAAIIQDAQNCLAASNVAVIVMHFWAFGDDSGNLIPANYQTLQDVLSWVGQQHSAGVALMTIGQYMQSKIIGLSGNLAFGNVTTGTTAASTLTITNSGTATLTVSSISYPSGFSGAWSGMIAAGGSHNVVVTFAPMAVTSYSGTVTIKSDAGGGTATLAASGAGIAPVPPPPPPPVTQTKIIGLSGSLAFGSVTNGATATKTLTITNSGNTTLTVSSISYPGGFSGAWSGTIAAGGSHNVVVTFAPTAVASYSGTVTVNSDATSGTATLAASGTGVAAVTVTKIIGLSGSLAFGSVTNGAAATKTLTITNSGNATLTVSSISYPGGFSGAWSGTIAAGGSHNVVVTFAPTAVASYSGTVTVNSDATSGTATLAVSGTGMAAAAAQLLQVTIQAATDDAYEANGKMNTSALETVAGISDTTTNRAGYRFAAVSLPKTAKVTSAHLSLAYNWASASQVNTVLYGEASDKSATFSTATSNLTSRVRTSNNLPWNNMTMAAAWGQTLVSPDITSIVQEIVSRPNWASGNPITILQYQSGSAQGTWEAVSFEGTKGTSCPTAVLVINYTQ